MACRFARPAVAGFVKRAGCQNSLPVVRNRAHGISQGVELAFACPQRRLGALAFGDFFSRDVDPDDFTGRIA